MNLNKIRISADGFDRIYIEKLNQNLAINRVHIGCIESNYKAIEKSEGIQNAVVHILINRIDNLDKLKAYLIKYKVRRILLIKGNPHPKPYKHDFNELISFFSSFLTVYVAAYPTSKFNLQSKKHIKIQVQILKRKISAGASEVYLQSSYNLRKLSLFKKALLDENIDIPINFGISPKISINQAYWIFKEIINSVSNLFNIRNLNFAYKLITSKKNQDIVKFHSELITSNIFGENDGIHITTLDVDLIPLLNQIIESDCNVSQNNKQANGILQIASIF